MNTEFLSSYYPKTHGFTSIDEMKSIEGWLNLEGKGVDALLEIRNEVVKFYDGEMDKENGRTDRFFKLLDAMQSVTAVIDNIIYSY